MAIQSNPTDGGSNELIQYLMSLGISGTASGQTFGLPNNSAASPYLLNYFNKLKSNESYLSSEDKSNMNILDFAFRQERDRMTANTLGPSTGNGYTGRVYKQLEFVTSMEDVPKDTRKFATDASRYNVQKVTEAMTKVGAGSYAGAPPLPRELIGTYQVTDTKTGQTKYYYVLKKSNTQPPNSLADGTVLPSKPEIANSEEKKKEKITGSGGTAPNNTKPVKYPKLWYSPDYKKIYDGEIQQTNLLLLETADMMLSNFDYKTIDYVPENMNPTISSENDELRVINYAEPPANIAVHQTNPFTANKTYEVVDVSITPLRQSLDESRNSDYQSILYNFGYHNKSNGFLRYRPYYSSNGTAYYDLSINIPDTDIVTRYKVYWIEEDGTI